MITTNCNIKNNILEKTWDTSRSEKLKLNI